MKYYKQLGLICSRHESATHDLIICLGHWVTGKKVPPIKGPTVTFDYYALGVAYIQECIH